MQGKGITRSKSVFTPCGVSSFFEICDSKSDGTKIRDPLRIGARGGGFIIRRGNVTRASAGSHDSGDQVIINGKAAPEARTTLTVIRLMRRDFRFPPVCLTHIIEPPIGSGFGTSGAGAIGTAIALSDLFDLRLTLKQASEYAHVAEIQSTTGLGTVISLVSGSGEVGVVTEPGCFSVGRVDALLGDYTNMSLICASFGPIEKASVLKQEQRRLKVNQYGRSTLKAIMRERTAASLLRESRQFAEKTGLATKELLQLADKAVALGAMGASQNMIGNAVHCLVSKSARKSFLKGFLPLVPKNCMFETPLCKSGPVLL